MNLQKDYRDVPAKTTSGLDSDRRTSEETRTTASREKLIRQFQRDFKEGQLSTRATSMRWVTKLLITMSDTLYMTLIFIEKSCV